MSDLRTFTHTFDVDGHPATAQVSPCSWMYKGYGLQVEVNILGSRRYFNEKATSFETATEADVARLASQVKVCSCVRCNGPAVMDDPSVHPKYSSKGLCPKCLTADFEAEFAKEQAKEAKREEAEDKKMVSKGYNFKTVAWIHPAGGGDDYQIVLYSVKAPTPAEMTKTLRARRSRVTDDYTTAAL